MQTCGRGHGHCRPRGRDRGEAGRARLPLCRDAQGGHGVEFTLPGDRETIRSRATVAALCIWCGSPGHRTSQGRMNDTASVEGDVRIRLFCALRLPDERATRWSSGSAAAGRAVPTSARATSVHVTLRYTTGTVRGATSSRSPRSSRQPPGPPGRPLSAHGYRETRSVGMLVLDDADGCCGRLSCGSICTARLERLASTNPRASSLASACHRGALSGAATAAAFTSGARAGRAVRSPVYHSVLRPTGAQYVALQEFGVGGG